MLQNEECANDKEVRNDYSYLGCSEFGGSIHLMKASPDLLSVYFHGLMLT